MKAYSNIEVELIISDYFNMLSYITPIQKDKNSGW